MNYGMVAAAVALLLLSTAVSLARFLCISDDVKRCCGFCVCQEFVVNIDRLIEGFITKGPQLPSGVESYFANVTETTFVIKGVLYNLQTLILDGVVVSGLLPS